MAAGGNWTIIRPPAIYGPRDREMLDLFRFARFGLLPLPPNKRLSIIHAGDLCGLILACLGDTISHARVYEPDDGRIDGWAPPDLARAIGRAVGRQVLPVTIPKGVLLLGVPLDRMLRGAGAKLTRDRVNYFSHPDWTAEASARPPENLWQPRIPTELGLAETARWYKASGWL